MKTLVTGAAGFVGSRIVDELLRGNEPVRALVRNPVAAGALEARGIEVICGDVREPAVVEVALADVGLIYHCAALVGHHSRRAIYDTNLTGLRNILEACARLGGKRLIFVSTVNVLGTRNLDPATENSPYRYSHDPAADVKIEAEKMAGDFARRGVNITVLRPGFIYGPGDQRNLPKLIDAVARGKFRFMGSRNNCVPIIHVEDVVQALILAARTPIAIGRTYNITDGTHTTIGEVADYLARLSNCPAPTKVLPYTLCSLVCLLFEILGKARLLKKPGPITRPTLRFLGTSRFVDISKARKELGFQPRFTFQTGMAAALQWINECQPEAVHGTAAVAP